MLPVKMRPITGPLKKTVKVDPIFRILFCPVEKHTGSHNGYSSTVKMAEKIYE